MAQGFPIRFGRYELLERLAVGGMAELFRARVRGAEGFEKTVVIKRLLPHMAADPHFNAMFVDEAKLTARLVHPRIAQTYELGRHDDELYIAMEFVDGIDGLSLLRELARRGERLPEAIAVQIAMAVLDALDYAHNQVAPDGTPMGIIHRDVSPSNVLLSRRGDIKLIDFGIARALEREHRTKAGTLKGKYGYMSPEQVLGESLDARSDLFAAGIVLAELLTGRRLFAAGNELNVLLMVRDARVDRLDRFGDHVDPALRSVLDRALRKEPDERYDSAAAFRDALEGWAFNHGARSSQRELAGLVNRLYDDIWRGRREKLAASAEAVIGIGEVVELGNSGGGERGQRGQIDGIPSGELAIGDSAPELSISSVTDEPRPDSDSGRIVDSHSDSDSDDFLSVEEIDIPEIDEEPPPGAIGRELDLQLAEATHDSWHDGGSWARLDLDRVRDADEDAVPQPIEDGPAAKSTRYPTIEEAVASVSLRDPDPAAVDFDDSEISGDSRASRPHRLPTVDEIVSAELPAPPRLGEVDAEPDSGGNLEIDPPIRVMYKLMSNRATGLLVVALGGIRKDIYLVDGAPTFVTSNLARELFGEYLVSQGALSEGELSMALAMMPHYGGKLGDTLVGLGLLKPLEVFRLLNRQVRAKLIDVCTWGKGEYSWYTGQKNTREAFPLDFEPWEVLGAGAMALPAVQVNAWVDAVADRRPRTVANHTVQPGDFQLGDDARATYDGLDGSKTVRELRARFNDPANRLRFMRVLYLFRQVDLLTFDEQ